MVVYYRWSISLAALDQLLTLIVRYTIRPYYKCSIISALYITNIQNPGGGMSIFLMHSMVLILAPIVLTVVTLYMHTQYRGSKAMTCALSMVVGGTLSNLADRILFGGVIDYAYLSVLHVYFNLADVLIVSGALAWTTLFFRERKTLHTRH